jgi:hypothetical protein
VAPARFPLGVFSYLRAAVLWTGVPRLLEAILARPEGASRGFAVGQGWLGEVIVLYDRLQVGFREDLLSAAR